MDLAELFPEVAAHGSLAAALAINAWSFERKWSIYGSGRVWARPSR